MWPVVLLASVAQPECSTFGDIYWTGTQLCERMWGGSYAVIDDEEAPAYQMQWEGSNPNDKVTSNLAFSKQARGKKLTGYDIDAQEVEVCSAAGEVNASHRMVAPGAVEGLGRCLQYKDASCCTAATAATLKTLFGDAFAWNRCGELSPACEKFFEAEGCFRECDPNAALFRKASPRDGFVQHPLEKLPVRKAYCDDWFAACKDDMFCSVGGGSVQRCAVYYNFKSAQTSSPAPIVYRTASGAKAAIVLLVVLGALLGMFVVYLVKREKQGKPVYAPLPTLTEIRAPGDGDGSVEMSAQDVQPSMSGNNADA